MINGYLSLSLSLCPDWQMNQFSNIAQKANEIFSSMVIGGGGGVA